jgi:hypothetical protein
LIEYRLIVLEQIFAAARLTKCGLKISDSQFSNVERRVPIERKIDDAKIQFVRACDRIEDDRAVFDSAAQKRRSASRFRADAERIELSETESPSLRRRGGRDLKKMLRSIL